MILWLIILGTVIVIIIILFIAIEAWISPIMMMQPPKQNKSTQAYETCTLCGGSRAKTVKSSIGPICTKCLKQHAIKGT